MSHMDITEVSTGTLVDIGSVRIDETLPIGKRLESYLQQIKNPYCFLCGNIPVKIEFAEGAGTFEDKVTDYFIGLKSR